MSMVSSCRMLVNKESTSRLAIYKFWSCLQTSSAKLNESVTVYSFSVKPKSIEYSEFLLPFESLFRDVKQGNLCHKGFPLIKARLLDKALSSY